jgi:hypothetical protein
MNFRILILLVLFGLLLSGCHQGKGNSPISKLSALDEETKPAVLIENEKIFQEVEGLQVMKEVSPLYTEVPQKTIDMFEYFPLHTRLKYYSYEYSNLKPIDRYTEYLGEITLNNKNYYAVVSGLANIPSINGTVDSDGNTLLYSTDDEFIYQWNYNEDEQRVYGKPYLVFPRYLELGKEYILENTETEFVKTQRKLVTKGFVDIEISGQLFENCLVIEATTNMEVFEENKLEITIKFYYYPGIGLVYSDYRDTANDFVKNEFRQNIVKTHFNRIADGYVLNETPVDTEQEVSVLPDVQSPTEKEALRKVLEYASLEWSNISYSAMYNGETWINGTAYLMFEIYSDMGTHKSNLGWFYVEKDTLKVYLYDVAADSYEIVY